MISDIDKIIKYTKGKSIVELEEEYYIVANELIKLKEQGYDFEYSENLPKGTNSKIVRYIEISEILKYQDKINLNKNKTQLRAEISKVKNDIIKLRGNICEICEFDLSELLEIHHIVPLKQNGDNSLENLLVVCPTCHRILHKFVSIQDDKIKNLDIWINNNFTVKQYEKLYDVILNKYYRLKREKYNLNN